MTGNKCKDCIYHNKHRSECMLKNDKKVDGEAKPCKDFK